VLNQTINAFEANAKFQAAMRGNPDHHERDVRKKITITHFPDGVEAFIDEAKYTWQDGAAFENPDDLEEEKTKRGEGDRAASIKVAGRRAKTAVRRLCKMIQADCMMTLTTRENIQDYTRMDAYFKAFRTRLEAIGGLTYVATYEPQKRGALHIHIACQQFPAWLRNEHGVRVKSYALISSIWSRVIGRGNGNVNFTKPRGRNSCHRIASYISKYVTKQFSSLVDPLTGAVDEKRFNKKKYRASRDIPKPRVTVMWFTGDTPTWDLVSMLAQDFRLNGYSDIAQYSDSMNQFHWFAASKP
jgi:hypothetical protein